MSVATCPKNMRYGPCGGVRADRSCEVDRRPCPFVQPDSPTVELPPLGRAHEWPGSADPLIVVDVRVPLGWPGDVRALWQRAAAALRGTTPLLGEHVDNPTLIDDAGSFDPLEAVAILRAGGSPPIVTVTGRDRTVEEARTIMMHAREAGAAAIHCVTGDHPHSIGIHRPATFGAESMTLVAAACEVGIAATVAESPSSPGERASRLAVKQRAGASLCILNHSGGAQALRDFADAARGAGASLPMVAPVAMVADADSALGLVSFPGLTLPDGHLEEILSSVSPKERAFELVAMLVRSLAETGRFAGINLSGGASHGDPWQRLALTEQFVDCVRGAWSQGRAMRAVPTSLVGPSR